MSQREHLHGRLTEDRSPRRLRQFGNHLPSHPSHEYPLPMRFREPMIPAAMTLKHLLLAVALLSTPISSALPADWRTTPVPGPADFTGHAWYRCWLKPHPSFFNKHERDLYGESVIFNIRGLAGAHEVFVNGTGIGVGGAFPPDFTDGRGGNHRHKVPSGTFVKDQWNEIAIHVYNLASPGGFQTEPPFIMNYFQECVFEGAWEFHPGEKGEINGAPLKDKPARAAFDQFHESNRVLGEAEKLVHGKKMPPAESLALMKPADDLAVDLLASEPQVAQPTHVSFDEKGRMWVAQYRQYPYPAGIRMLSRDHYYRAHYDKLPEPPPNNAKGRDRISIHEDTTGDGRYDKYTVFQDGLNMANCALRGHGGVWVMNTPYLLFYPDKNFDDIPDGPPEVRLQGFGFEDTHAVANGLVWGMDGWLYGAEGSTVSCNVTRPGIDPPGADGVSFVGCMVWRYHPERREFELFAEGGGNNFGLEVDAQGRLYTGHNGGQTRGWHYVQGGYYQMQGVSPGKYGPPHNPFAFGNLPKMRSDSDIQRFTHFAAMAEGSALPARYRDCFFAIDPLHNFVIASKRNVEGATFSTVDLQKVLVGGDFAFRPVYILNAPDGSITVADFYEHYIAHGQHYQSQIDPTTGRIYRLRGKDMKLETDLNLAAKTSTELVGLLSHPNKWHRQTAVRLLGERKDPKVRPALRRLVEMGSGLDSMHALWAHYQAFGIDDELATAALHHDYAPARYWGVRLACDAGKVSPALLDAIDEAIRYERDAEVRSQMAASAKRLPVEQAFRLAKSLFAHDEDLKDAYVPLMCWWILEAKADDNREALLGLFEDKAVWDRKLVAEHILPRVMRWFASKGGRQNLLACARLLKIAPKPEHAARLLAGFEEAYKGRPMNDLPPQLAKALVDSGRSSLALRLRLGDAAAAKASLALLTNSKTALAERIQTARILGEMKQPDARSRLLAIALGKQPVDLRKAAVAALMAYDAADIGEKISASLSNLPADLRPMAFDLLLSRVPWAASLLTGLEDGGVSKELLDDQILLRLRNHPDKSVRAKAAEVVPATETATNNDWNKHIAALDAILKKKPGNPYAGEPTFLERCGGCHKLFYKGGEIGPDLTVYQRDNLNTMLISVVNPNAEIREGFEYVSLATKDGRNLSGFMVDQDAQAVALRVPGGEDVRLQRSELEAITPMGRSLMPEGILAGLTDDQLRDLFAYIRISQPITK